MVNNELHATYTETYDLNTAIGELSILGLHTPQALSLKKMFKGLFEQYKKYKILGCNLSMVCASQQSMTPDLIGLEAGQIDPRDVLNPILFKACTGENLNVLLNQIYNDSETINNSNGSGSIAQHVDTRTSATNAYYQLLADNSWRKEHPQRGLTVMGLRPMVHKIVTTQPFAWTGNVYEPHVGLNQIDPTQAQYAYGFGGVSGTNKDNTNTQRNNTVFVSNGMTDMPWLDTTIDNKGLFISDPNEGTTETKKANVLINSVPRVYLGCIVLPPAILQRLFFRMQIVWHIAFKDFRPAYEVGPLDFEWGEYAQNDCGICSFGSPDTAGGQGNYTTYWNLYHSAVDSNLSKAYSSFDSNGLSEVESINESVS